ncbi:MAG: hypothetical protein JNL70_00210 [Saprospiraceae bacterium]|nr:hypothetical protein [Saprospiraceae bacterium]
MEYFFKLLDYINTSVIFQMKNGGFAAEKGGKWVSILFFCQHLTNNKGCAI